MKILITGGTGQLGTELQRILCSFRSEIGVIPCDYIGALVDVPSHKELDLSSISSVNAWMQNHKYDLIFNCAAMTDVDGCEKNEALALHINAIAVEHLAMYANKQNAKFVHISTIPMIL